MFTCATAFEESLGARVLDDPLLIVFLGRGAGRAAGLKARFLRSALAGPSRRAPLSLNQPATLYLSHVW